MRSFKEPIEGLSLNMLGRPILIESPHAPLFKLLVRLFEPFIVSATYENATRIVAVQEATEWRVDVDGERFGGSPSPWGALIDVRNAAVEAALADQTDFISLHAAVVVRDGDAVLLAGEPWAGKTTFSLRLIQEGWRHFSDDVAPIHLKSGKVHAFPKPPAVRTGSWEDFRHLWDPQPDWLPVPADWFIVPVTNLPRGEGPATPRVLVHLKYEKEATAQIGEISAADALIRCAPQTRAVSGPQLAALAAVCRRANRVELQYSDTEEGLDLLRSYLAACSRGG